MEEMEEMDEECRTCMNQTKKSTSVGLSQIILSNTKENIKIADMLQYCLPQIKIFNADINRICHNCLNSLKISYHFKRMCLENEIKFICDNNREANPNFVFCGDNQVDNKSHKNLEKYINNQVGHNTEDNTFNDNKYSEICNKKYKKPQTKKKWHIYKNRFANEECDGCKNALLDVSFHCGTYLKDTDCVCLHCRKTFKHLADIKRHMYLHVPKVCCEKCGKKFRDSYQLDRHLKSHNKERPYTCPICSQSFASHHSRNVHLQNHKDKTCNSCPTCNKQFSTKFNLQVHLDSIKNSTKCVCQICHRRFPTQKSLDSHKCFQEHLRCKICSKYLATKYGLQTHLRAHNPERPACIYCKKWFYTENNVKVHQETCLQKLEQTYIENIKFEIPDLVEIKTEDVNDNYYENLLQDPSEEDKDDYFFEGDESEIKKEKADILIGW